MPGARTHDDPDRRGDELDVVVDGLLGLSHRVMHDLATVAARHELTTQQVGLLRRLAEPVSMGGFAGELACDPSNVTGLIDRLERLGLVERVQSPADRRVRLLILTAHGRRLRDVVNTELAHELAGTFGLRPENCGGVGELLEHLTPVSAATPRRG